MNLADNIQKLRPFKYDITRTQTKLPESKKHFFMINVNEFYIIVPVTISYLSCNSNGEMFFCITYCRLVGSNPTRVELEPFFVEIACFFHVCVTFLVGCSQKACMPGIILRIFLLYLEPVSADRILN